MRAGVDDGPTALNNPGKAANPDEKTPIPMPERQTLRDSDNPMCPELCLPMHSSLPSHGARRPKPAPGVSTTNGLGSGSPVVVAKINNGYAIGAFWGLTMARL